MHLGHRYGVHHLALALLVALGGFSGAACSSEATGAAIEFSDDVREQTQEFIGYYDTIELTPEQEAIKHEALTAIPAPCCSNNTAYTCCCPCNMARSYWGLSHFLIARKGADAETVRTAVEEWIDRINPSDFSGDVCYSPGGCMRAFEHNGCGGMKAGQVVWPAG